MTHHFLRSRSADSIGGVVEVVARNVPAGLGSPVFCKLEAELAKAAMSLPASKGFEVSRACYSISKGSFMIVLFRRSVLDSEALSCLGQRTTTPSISTTTDAPGKPGTYKTTVTYAKSITSGVMLPYQIELELIGVEACKGGSPTVKI